MAKRKPRRDPMAAKRAREEAKKELDHDEELFMVDDSDIPASTPAKKKVTKKSKTTKKKVTKKAAKKKPVKKKSSKAPTEKKPRGNPLVHSPDVQLVNMDKGRKLTKKQREKLAPWKTQGEKRIRVVDNFFRAQMEATQREKGRGNLMATGDHDNLLIGIDIDNIAFEYVLGHSAFPLGLVMQIVGPPGSLKSSLLYEIFRWFRVASGGGFLMEHESKFSLELLNSIMQLGPDDFGVMLEQCESVEDWQTKLTYWVKKEQKMLLGTKENPGPGRCVPICFGIDSIMGKLAEESQEKILKAGHAGRAHALEAMIITYYLKTIPNLFVDWPFAMVMINHLKMGKDDNGIDKRGKAGGEGVSFQESWELETKVRTSKIECASWDGVKINIKCYKNSFGQGRRAIDTRMRWWDELNPETGDYEQVTVWDWDWALVELLRNLKLRPKAKFDEQELHIATPKTSAVENTAWSRSLGMKERDAVPWDELGRMLHENKDVATRLRRALGIKPIPILSGDYAQQRDALAEEIE